jgi:FkbM family methyltransferase
MSPRRDPLYAVRQRLARSRVRRLLPGWMRRAIRAALDAPAFIPIVSDVRSLAMLLPPKQAASAAAAVPVRLRRLGGGAVYVRPGTADVAVVRNIMLTLPHLPPEEFLPADVRLVWDLGAHIGVSAADYATLWPDARIIAVELEPTNAELCRRNLAAFGQRCEVIEGAVWPHDGRVAIRMPADPGGLSTNAYSASEGVTTDGVPAISLHTLLARAGDRATVDVVKLDVEGAERQILRENTDWAERVRSIVVEVHGDYAPDHCEADLRALGFSNVGAGHAPDVVAASR